MRQISHLASGLFLLSVTILTTTSGIAAEEPRQSQLPTTELDTLLKVDPPIVLCIDDKPTTGGQPTEDAYTKAMANGFRSVLTLRSRNDGVDLLRERLMVEKSQLRYFNLPTNSIVPRIEQVDEFLRLLRDKGNQPMMINCAFAERVAPYMMIFHIVEQGWSDDKSIDEAARSGLRADQLRIFLRQYRIRHHLKKD
ncbi:MAG TPA: hypothetical protein VEI95_15615, partial [Acidobacteriota bacterium]|nr:hypothetical protein [Acidobacteriota bacterium]